MTQLTFDNPIAHSDDGPPSREAAARLEDSGARRRNADTVLAMVRKWPGLTCVELWVQEGQGVLADLGELQEVRRRMTDLWHARRVLRGDSRKCRVKGSLMYTWNAT